MSTVSQMSWSESNELVSWMSWSESSEYSESNELEWVEYFVGEMCNFDHN